MIHPTAVIHPKAQVAENVEVGPYAVIDEHVTLGVDCVLGPQVHLTGHTEIGANNRFHTGCVIGDAPQDFKYDNSPTKLRIGEGNTFREHVTVHRSNKLEEDTIVGSHNFLMAHSHVGHNCILHDNIIMANGALLGGHVEVFDRVFISGNCLAHQFVRIGTMALMQGGAGISMDLPPYCISWGDNGLCGLNVVGLRRAGMGATDRAELKRCYLALLHESGEVALEEFQSTPARRMIEFVKSSKRGVCRHKSRCRE